MDNQNEESKDLQRQNEVLKFKIDIDAKHHDEEKRQIAIEKDKKIKALENENNKLKTKVGDQVDNIKQLNSAITEKDVVIDDLRQKEEKLSEKIKHLEIQMQKSQMHSKQLRDQQVGEIKRLQEELAMIKAKKELHKEQKLLLEEQFQMFQKGQEVRDKEREIQDNERIKSIKEEMLKTIQDDLRQAIQEDMRKAAEKQNAVLLENLKIVIAKNTIVPVTKESEQMIIRDAQNMQVPTCINSVPDHIVGQRSKLTSDQFNLNLPPQSDKTPVNNAWVPSAKRKPVSNSRKQPNMKKEEGR